MDERVDAARVTGDGIREQRKGIKGNKGNALEILGKTEMRKEDGIYGGEAPRVSKRERGKNRSASFVPPSFSFLFLDSAGSFPGSLVSKWRLI